jgi:hypothetical protein
MRRVAPLKRYLFGLIVLLFLLGFAELMAFASTRVLREFFRPSDDSIAALLAPDAYEQFLERDFDSELGWRPPADHVERRANCVGDPIELTYDGDRKRVDPSAPNRPIEIITVGDSFTHGDDADNAATYPAQLAALTGQGVANYGVSGYGPAQAVLRFEAVLERHAGARTAVLGIMYENIGRLATRWTTAYYSNFGIPFGFKPFVDPRELEAGIQPNPNRAALPYADLLALAHSVLREDFWAKPPPASFPYLLSMARLFGDRAFDYRVLQRWRRFVDGTTFPLYEDAAAAAALAHVVERFIASAAASGMQPVVVFMPEHPRDRVSASALVHELRAGHPEAILLDVGDVAMDWDRYLVANQRGCHPSSEGYQAIARYVADALPPSP